MRPLRIPVSPGQFRSWRFASPTQEAHPPSPRRRHGRSGGRARPTTRPSSRSHARRRHPTSVPASRPHSQTLPPLHPPSLPSPWRARQRARCGPSGRTGPWTEARNSGPAGRGRGAGAQRPSPPPQAAKERPAG